MELETGTVLLGKYRVDEVLGTGGMGRVVRASHLYLQQSVAIKILLPGMADSPSTVARFLREAQATVRLKSEHIARVIDVGTMPDSTPFMVMEYLEGNDLNQILRHHGPQTPSIVCDLMLQVCEGLAEAHALGFVHRDIKPSNFYITRRPDGSMLLKILDFGISKTPVGYDELTGTQTVIGTPSYMAPEQMKTAKGADHRSDIWSIGVVMYQLLQGRPPFAGESYADLVLKVGTEAPEPLHVPLPAGLAQVIHRCLEKDPKNRQQNVGELARMLAPFASDPIQGAQISGRTTRILQARQSQPGFGQQHGQQGLPLSAGGGLVGPVPLSPAQLTPRSWPPSTSTSHGKGQVTHRSKGGRGWLIAGITSVAILAGAGGYIASEILRGDEPRDDTSVPAPPAAAAAPAVIEAKDLGVATAAGPGSGSGSGSESGSESGSATAAGAGSGSASAATAATGWKPTATTPTILAKPTTTPDVKPKVVAEAPTTKPSAVAKPVTKPVAKPTPTKPTPTPVKPKAKPKAKPPAKGDLFDSRH